MLLRVRGGGLGVKLGVTGGAGQGFPPPQNAVRPGGNATFLARVVVVAEQVVLVGRCEVGRSLVETKEHLNGTEDDGTRERLEGICK